MIIFNSVQLCCGCCHFCCLIAGCHIDGGDDDVIVVHFTLSLFHSIPFHSVERNVHWTLSGILTFIGIARKFNQKFYSPDSSSNLLQTQYIMSDGCCHCSCCRRRRCGRHHCRFYDLNIPIVHAHQPTCKLYRTIRILNISKCNQHCDVFPLQWHTILSRATLLCSVIRSVS